MTYLQHKNLKPEDFKRLSGVHKETFARMVSVIQEQVEQKKRKPGKPSKLSVEDQVLMSLEYWREDRTYFHIGQSWAVHEATVCRIVKKVENALLRCGIFLLPGKKQLLAPESVANLVVIDATETPIERPKKGQKRFYSGKKKRHTLKSQLVVDPKTKAISCTTFAAGKEHDFHLFKRSSVKLKKETKCLADKGYQGIQKFHPNSQLPKKKRSGKPLCQLDREMNQSLERTHGICERVIGRLKVFKILAERYRNRRKRFGLRFNLIAALYNYELGLSKPS
jgi:hypothetical protein